MATFVLVHGAWHGGWCWQRVARRLREAGHEVYTPTLTGLGERRHLASPDVDLDTHIRDVIGVLEFEELADVVICGHSYGGMVITGVAESAARYLRALVYLDAFVPGDGDSVFSLVPREMVDRYRRGAAEQGDGWRVPKRTAESFGVREAADRAWVDRRITEHLIATFEQPLRHSEPWRNFENLTYIHAEGHEPSPFPPFAARTEADPAWRTLRLPCGHDIMVDMPEELTGMLMDAAAR